MAPFDQQRGNIWPQQRSTYQGPARWPALVSPRSNGHGPATIQDFRWWTGLTAAETRTGLELARTHLIAETVADQTFWMAPDLPRVKHAPAAPYLLPGFDEYMLGYKDRSASLEAQYAPYIAPGGGMFSPTIIMDGRVVGTWKRTFKNDTVVVAVSRFTSLSEAQSRAIAVTAERYARFVGMSPMVVSKSGIAR